MENRLFMQKISFRSNFVFNSLVYNIKLVLCNSQQSFHYQVKKINLYKFNFFAGNFYRKVLEISWTKYQKQGRRCFGT